MHFRHISAKNLKQHFGWGGPRSFGLLLGYTLGSDLIYCMSRNQQDSKITLNFKEDNSVTSRPTEYRRIRSCDILFEYRIRKLVRLYIRKLVRLYINTFGYANA